VSIAPRKPKSRSEEEPLEATARSADRAPEIEANAAQRAGPVSALNQLYVHHALHGLHGGGELRGDAVAVGQRDLDLALSLALDDDEGNLPLAARAKLGCDSADWHRIAQVDAHLFLVAHGLVL